MQRLTTFFILTLLITPIHLKAETIQHYDTAQQCYNNGYDHCVELRNRHTGKITWIPKHHYIHVKQHHNIIKDSYKTKSGKILKKEYIKD